MKKQINAKLRATAMLGAAALAAASIMASPSFADAADTNPITAAATAASVPAGIDPTKVSAQLTMTASDDGASATASVSVKYSGFPVPNIPVVFTVTGSATLTATDGSGLTGQTLTVNSNSAGTAAVTVTDDVDETVSLAATALGYPVPGAPVDITFTTSDQTTPAPDQTTPAPDQTTPSEPAQTTPAEPAVTTPATPAATTPATPATSTPASIPAGIDPTKVAAQLTATPASDGSSLTASVSVKYSGFPVPNIPVVFTVTGSATLTATDGSGMSGQTLTVNSNSAGIAAVTVTDAVSETVSLTATAMGYPVPGSPATVTFSGPAPAASPTVITSASPNGVTGTAQPGSPVAVTFPNGSSASTTADPSSGAWSVAWPAGLTVCGTVNAVATVSGNPVAADPFNAGACSAPVTLSAPVVTAPAAGATSTTAKPTFSGTGAPGAQVSVVENGTVWCLATVNASGAWSCTPTQAMPAGSHTVLVAQTDSASNLSPSTPRVFTVRPATSTLQPGLVPVVSLLPPKGTPVTPVYGPTQPTQIGTPQLAALMFWPLMLFGL